MTDHKDARQLLADITAGLEGVTPGPWRQTYDFRDDGEDFCHVQSLDGLSGLFLFDYDCDKPIKGFSLKDGAHIARCDPDTMRAISDLVAEKDRRIAELEAERQWRPITDLIPENGTIVMGWGEYRERDGFSPAFMRWYDRSQGWFVNAMPFYPTHWMPLPASPHEGKQS